MEKKGFILVAVMTLLLSMQMYVNAADSTQVNISLNGSKIDAVGIVDRRNICLPLRSICEELGYKVDWSGTDSQIHISKADKNITVELKKYKITSANGHTYYMSGDDYVKTVDGAAYIGKGFFEDNFGFKVTMDTLNNTVEIESVTQNDITITNINETSSTDTIDVTLNYPQIDGISDKNVSDKINAVLKQDAQDAKNQGIQTAQQIAEETKGYIGEINKDETYFDYRIKYNQNGLLSLILLNYQYTGGAHGMTKQTSYTFNLKTGEQIALKDLMKPGSDYVLTYNKIVNSEIIKRELCPLTSFENIKDNQDYYLSNEGVAVYFQQYEYFCYAAGIQAFTADYSVLKDMLNTQYSFLSDSTKVLDSKDSNVLNIGQNGKVVLKGNPTTGYTWHYTIEDNNIIKLASESSIQDSNLMGAGSTFIWNFKALKAGETKITFKYYRDWESSAKDTDTVEYTITVNPSDASYNTAPFYQSKIVYEADDGLYCVYINNGESIQLVKGSGISKPLISCDGSAVVFVKDNNLYAYDFSTYQTKLLINNCLSYCTYKDDEFFASTQKNGIVMVDPKLATFWISVPSLNNVGYSSLKASPDFKYLAYSFTSYAIENKDSEGLWLLDTSTNQTRLIVKDEQNSESSLGTMSRAGKWSPDSKKIFVWLMARSASMNADGVSTAIYDLDINDLHWLDAAALAYDNNISFADSDKFAVIIGGGREMFENKYLEIFDKNNNYTTSDVEMTGMVTTSPCYSNDGQELVFVASPTAKDDGDYKTQIASTLKRQIYMYKDGKITELTNDNENGCETPIFLDNNYIVFAKTSNGKDKSIWIMNSDGSNQRQIVQWGSKDENKAFDFYGRIDWSSRFTMFDNTK